MLGLDQDVTEAERGRKGMLFDEEGSLKLSLCRRSRIAKAREKARVHGRY